MDPQTLLKDLPEEEKDSILASLQDIDATTQEDRATCGSLAQEWKHSYQTAWARVTDKRANWSTKATAVAQKYSDLLSKIGGTSQDPTVYQPAHNIEGVFPVLIGSYGDQEDFVGRFTAALKGETFCPRRSGITFEPGTIETVERLRNHADNMRARLTAAAAGLNNL